MADYAWLKTLADSRLGPAAAGGTDQGACSSLLRDRDAQGRLRLTLCCGQPEADLTTSAAVARLLLETFAAKEGTRSSSRAAGQGLLARSVEVTLPSMPPAAAAGEGQQAAAASAAQPLQVQFTATDPAAEEAVEEAARLFEAYWQYHLKAAKSDLHCRMRQRLTALRQQLLLTKYDGL